MRGISLIDTLNYPLFLLNSKHLITPGSYCPYGFHIVLSPEVIIGMDPSEWIEI